MFLIVISFNFPAIAIRYAQAAIENAQQQSNSTANAQESANTRPYENSINSGSMENNATSNSEKSSLRESCGGEYEPACLPGVQPHPHNEIVGHMANVTPSNA